MLCNLSSDLYVVANRLQVLLATIAALIKSYWKGIINFLEYKLTKHDNREVSCKYFSVISSGLILVFHMKLLI